MKHVLGIDLGTSTTVVSTYRDGEPVVLPIDGRITMPSVVYVGDNGQVEIGHPAVARLAMFPKNVIVSSKRFMGNPKKYWEVGGRRYSPVEVASIILSRVRKAAADFLGEDVFQAVITVPAYFNDAQRRETAEAGAMAGLEVLRLIPEPTAAAISYGLDQAVEETILVYDLGGGTFDVSVMRVEQNDFTVLSVDGDDSLGGDDFTAALARHIVEKIELDLPRTDEFHHYLTGLAEDAKLELSEREWADINVQLPDAEICEVRLSRARYNSIIRSYLIRTIDKVNNCLHSAGLGVEAVDRVILVGGSTRNTAVRELVADAVKEPYQADNVDLAVSFGAAIAGARHLGSREMPADVEMQNVTAHTLGIDMVDKYGNSYFQPLIHKNTGLPTRACAMGFAKPRQRHVVIGVYRGDSPRPAENTFLGELHLPIASAIPEPVPVVALFELDEDGILTFTSVECPPTDDLNGELGVPLIRRGGVDIEVVMRLLERGVLSGVSVEIEND